MTIKSICFDMDGTIADLYGVEDWLPMLRNEDATPYAIAAPMYDMDVLNNLLCEFIKRNIEINVISWGSKFSSKEYLEEVRNVKIAWINHYLPCITDINVVQYGTPKQNFAKYKESVLVDDEKQNLDAWSGRVIDAKQNILVALENLLSEI